MTDGVTVRTNLPAFVAQVNELKADLQKKTVAAGVRAAGAVYRVAARGFAPVLQGVRSGRVAGALRRNIYSGIPRSQTPGQVRGIVSVRNGKKSQKGKGDPFYWRFLEGGWIPRGPGNKLRGGEANKALARAGSSHQRKQFPFLRPAFAAVGTAPLTAFNERINQRLIQFNQTPTPKP